MLRQFLHFLFIASTLGSLNTDAAEDLPPDTARSQALQLAGAFTANDGYKARDGFYNTTLAKGEGKLVAVNLYAGDNYWFCVASADPAQKLQVLVFDEAGKPVPILTYNDAGKAAAGFTPNNSGLFYVKMSLLEGNSTPVCFLYTYK